MMNLTSVYRTGQSLPGFRACPLFLPGCPGVPRIWGPARPFKPARRRACSWLRPILVYTMGKRAGSHESDADASGGEGAGAFRLLNSVHPNRSLQARAAICPEQASSSRIHQPFSKRRTLNFETASPKGVTPTLSTPLLPLQSPHPSEFNCDKKFGAACMLIPPNPYPVLMRQTIKHERRARPVTHRRYRAAGYQLLATGCSLLPAPYCLLPDA
jgi:hypothetical protein